MYRLSFCSSVVHLLLSTIAVASCGGSARASMLPITVLEQTHHAWGNIQLASYDELAIVPVSGSCSEVIGTDFIQMESNTLGSDADELKVYAYVDSVEEYGYGESANAEISYLFNPNASMLTIDFNGTSAFHEFESWLTYSLQDLTTGATLDTRSWERTLSHGWVDDVLPYTGTYAMVMSHTYSITVSAVAQLGDQREGYAYLTAVVTPEPSLAMLLGIALTTAAGLRRRGA